MPEMTTESPNPPRRSRYAVPPPLDQIPSLTEVLDADGMQEFEHEVVPSAPGRPMETGEDLLRTQDLRVRRDRQGGTFEVADDRPASCFRSAHVDRMRSVLRGVATGRVGMLERSGTDRPGLGNPSAKENVDLGSALSLELLEEGDGAGEVMLASSAASAYMIASRVSAVLNATVTSGRGSLVAREAKDWGRTLASMMRAASATIVALGRVRAARRDWERELKIVRDDDAEVPHVRIEPAGRH